MWPQRRFWKIYKGRKPNVLEHWNVLAQHEPNQTYMEDKHEVSMKLFIICTSQIPPLPLPPWVHVPKLAGHNCPTKMVLPLRLPARNWQCYGASPAFYTTGHKLVCQVAPLYSCVHLYTHCTVCIAQLSPSWNVLNIQIRKIWKIVKIVN